MARFVDHAAALDVEIVDDWLFLYAPREASTLDPPPGPGCSPSSRRCSTSSRSGSAGATSAWPRPRSTPPPPRARGRGLGDSAVRGTDGILRPPPGVAPEGRRLRRRVPWAAIIVIGAAAADAVRPAGRVRVDHRELSN
jgi:hypothetical protein